LREISRILNLILQHVVKRSDERPKRRRYMYKNQKGL